jgi:hypothetical protein
MAIWKIEIQGRDAVEATEELLAIEGIEGIYQTLEEVEREATLVTIATIAGIANGIMIIGEKLYEWNQKYQKSLQTPNDSRIKKVLIVFDDNRRLLLKDATLE